MLRSLQPTYAIASFGDISIEALREQQPDIKALSHDIDGYLLGYTDEPESIPRKHLEVMREAQESGLSQAIITNTGTGTRAERSHDIAAYIKNEADLDDLPIVNTSMPGCTKKPSKSMFLEVAKILGVEPSEICHGGDQMLKDVLGANRAGYGATILTPRFGNTDDLRVKLAQRPIETALRPALGLPLTQGSFPTILIVNGGRPRI